MLVETNVEQNIEMAGSLDEGVYICFPVEIVENNEEDLTWKIGESLHSGGWFGFFLCQ